MSPHGHCAADVQTQQKSSSCVATLTNENREVGKKRYLMSPHYKELPFTKKVPGTCSEAKSITPIADYLKKLSRPSPYYRGLLYREKDVSDGTNIKTNDIRNIMMVSPYYKGLLFSIEEKVPDGAYIRANNIQSLRTTSPYYRGLLFSTEEEVPEKKVSAKFACCYLAKHVPRRDYIPLE